MAIPTRPTYSESFFFCCCMPQYTYLMHTPSNLYKFARACSDKREHSSLHTRISCTHHRIYISSREPAVTNESILRYTQHVSKSAGILVPSLWATDTHHSARWHPQENDAGKVGGHHRRARQTTLENGLDPRIAACVQSQHHPRRDCPKCAIPH